MIRIQGDEGEATYYLDPYPHWDGDEAMEARGESIRVNVDRELVAQGMKPDAKDRSRRIHAALLAAFKLSGITVVEEQEPPLDPDYDPYLVR